MRRFFRSLGLIFIICRYDSCSNTHTTLIHTYNIYTWSDTCVYLGDVVISFSWFFYNLFISLLPGCTHLKDLLSGHLYTTVSRLWLLQWQLVPEQLQLMDQVSLVACCHVSISSTAAAYSATSSILAPHLHLGGLGGFLCLGLLAGSVEKQKKSGGEETRWREEEKGWKKEGKSIKYRAFTLSSLIYCKSAFL